MRQMCTLPVSTLRCIKGKTTSCTYWVTTNLCSHIIDCKKLKATLQFEIWEEWTHIQYYKLRKYPFFWMWKNGHFIYAARAIERRTSLLMGWATCSLLALDILLPNCLLLLLTSERLSLWFWLRFLKSRQEMLVNLFVIALLDSNWTDNISFIVRGEVYILVHHVYRWETCYSKYFNGDSYSMCDTFFCTFPNIARYFLYISLLGWFMARLERC